MSGETAESKGSGAARAETSAPRRPRGSPRHRFLGRWTARLAWLAAGALVAIAALYVVRYRYGGEAVEGGPSIFFAAVSGTTGKVVASHHPSALKSVVGRLGRLFSGG